MSFRRLLPLCLVPWLAACWTPQHAETVWRGHAMSLSRDGGGEADPVAVRLTRPVRQKGDAAARPGDVAVYRIEVESPAAVTRRYLRLTVEERPDDQVSFRTVRLTRTRPSGEVDTVSLPSMSWPVRIELFDADGAPAGASRAEHALVDLLARGFFGACEVFEREGIDREDEAVWTEAMTSSFPAILAIGEVLNSDPTLRDLAMGLVDKSLALTAIWHFGISFHIEPRIDLAERIEREALTGAPGRRFPVQLSINGHPALRLAATVVAPSPALGLTAGITRVDGFRPTDDRYRVRAEFVPAATVETNGDEP